MESVMRRVIQQAVGAATRTVLLATSVLGAACAGSERDANRLDSSAGPRAQCPETVTRDIVAAADPKTVAIDLDCSGRMDSVMIRRVGFMNVLIVARDGGTDTTRLAEEVAESLISFADLDTDGVFDVLLVESDESSILPRVFALGGGATRELPFDLPPGVTSVTVLRDLEHASECIERAKPALVRDSLTRPAVSVVPYTSPSLQCDTMTRLTFLVENGRLVNRVPR